MPRYPSPSSVDRRPSNAYSQTSDAILFGITRGASGLPRRDPGSSGRQIYNSADTFEESYPRYEFSTLVELSFGLLRWLIRLRKKAAAADKAPSGPHPSTVRVSEIARSFRHNRAGWRRQQSPL